MTVLKRMQSVCSLGVLVACMIASLNACVDIQGPEREMLQPGDVLAAVKIRSNAIMIAKGDSQQIAFDLIAMNNEAIPVDWTKITWKSLEGKVVTVSPRGVLYGANISSSPILVTVEYVHKYVTKHDTVNVYVTEGKIDANEIKLVALDSTRVGGQGNVSGTPRVRIDLYKDGALVTKGALIPIQVDAPAVGAVDIKGGPDQEPVYRIINQKILLGKFWIRSSLNLYGSEVNDSVSFTGLYGDQVSSLISVMTLPPNTVVQVPILDTIPLKTFQLCAGQSILNLSSDTVDIVFSDSTASPTGCAPGNGSLTNWPGFLSHGEYIGGNVLKMPPYSVALRRSSTSGVISYTVRKSTTKERLPAYASHWRQQDVEE